MNEYLYWIFERRKVQGIQLILYSVPFEWSKKPRGWSGSDLFCCIHFVSHSCNPYSEWFNVCGYSFRYSQYSQSYGFSSGHLWMWELDSKERWAPKTWCFWTVVLEKTLERPLDCKEIQPVHPKGDQSWVFIGRTDAEAETPILWPPHVKSRLIWKDSDAGTDWGQEEKGMTEDEMAGWHHRLDGHEFG